MGKTIYNDERFSVKALSGERGETIETMLYDGANDCTHFLNLSAIKILELACDGKKNDEIEKEIRKYFNISEGKDIKKDIEKALAIFKKNRLIE